MRKILNNLWSQRTNNVWLFLELIVVCFVAWTQLDPIIVRLYYRSLPSGIDGERMVVANILYTQPYEMADESMTQEEMNNQYMKREAQYAEEANVIKRQLLAIDGVEQASIAPICLEAAAMPVSYAMPGRTTRFWPTTSAIRRTSISSRPTAYGR